MLRNFLKDETGLELSEYAVAAALVALAAVLAFQTLGGNISSKINDREGVEKMIYSDRRARWPSTPAHRPHARYLAWHRERFGFQAQN